jgi:hypothetical protein
VRLTAVLLPLSSSLPPSLSLSLPLLLLLLCSNKEELTEARLKGVHCLLLPLPTQPFAASEVAALHAFVDAGGSLVVLAGEGGPGTCGSNLNELVSK